MPIIKLKQNELIRVFGPASINVKLGVIDVYRKKFEIGESFIIHKLRSCVIQSITDSELEINLGSEASLAQLDDRDSYMNWLETLSKILDSKPKSIIVIGNVDSGKSTFSIMIANEALNKGLKPAVIDSDVGQADIGPPCFITMSYPDYQVIWMREYKAVHYKFIGDNKPQYKIDEIIYAVKELMNRAVNDNRNIVVVDTDGWIGDENAIVYKYKLITSIKPDILVVIGRELQDMFSKLEKIGVKVYTIDPPQYRRTRNREERKLLRRDKYREYLENGKLVKISFDNLIVLNNPLFNTTPVETPVQLSDRILFISRGLGKLYVVSKTSLSNEEIEFLKNTYGVSHIRIYNENYFENILVALSNGTIDYPALLVKVDFRNRELLLKTKFSNDFKLIKFSSIKLREDYVEEIIEKED
ncbi:MAG: Clp1/GlmU family protein [Desulfurococcaceae archaeon]